MPRPLRIHFEGAIYHVVFRGNERRDIFYDGRDAEAFLDRLVDRIARFGTRLYLFCLMPNHVHLLLETPGANLSAFMGSLLTSYTNYFNTRHRRAGHLTQGRFKSPLVDGNDYLLRLSRYIHLNPLFVSPTQDLPLEDRLTHLRGYRWSSYRSYAGLAPEWPWISYAPILDLASEGATRAAYARYVEAGLATTDDEFVALVHRCHLGLGTDEFLSRVSDAQRTEGKRQKHEDRVFRRTHPKLPPDRILQSVADYYGRSVASLRLHKKNDWAKAVAAHLLGLHCGLSCREIAPLLGVKTGAAVSSQIGRLRLPEGEPALSSVKEIEGYI